MSVNEQLTNKLLKRQDRQRKQLGRRLLKPGRTAKQRLKTDLIRSELGIPELSQGEQQQMAQQQIDAAAAQQQAVAQQLAQQQAAGLISQQEAAQAATDEAAQAAEVAAQAQAQAAQANVAMEAQRRANLDQRLVSQQRMAKESREIATQMGLNTFNQMMETLGEVFGGVI